VGAVKDIIPRSNYFWTSVSVSVCLSVCHLKGSLSFEAKEQKFCMKIANRDECNSGNPNNDLPNQEKNQ